MPCVNPLSLLLLGGAVCLAQPVQEIPLSDRVERFPVVTTGRRWPSMDEIRGPAAEVFKQYPQAAKDPRRSKLPPADFPEPHARGGGMFPVLLLMDNGQLACVMRTGAPHVGSGSEISIAFSRDRGRTWSRYQVVVRSAGERDRRNPSLGQAANGDLVVVYNVYTEYDAKGKPTGNRGGFSWMESVRSRDQGRTWTAPVKVPWPPGVQLGPYGQMRRLKDGTLVFNARGNPESDTRRRTTYLYWSRDNGRTWPEMTLIKEGMTETGFLPLDGSRWVAYARAGSGPPMLGFSGDGGKTWGRWEKTLGSDQPQVRGRIPGSLTRLPNGLVLATYGYREYPFGWRAVVSRDGGKSFDHSREYVLADTYLLPDSGYPSTVAYPDGTVVTVAYTIADLDHPEWGTACIAYRYTQRLFE
jgi:hypothetical protein